VVKCRFEGAMGFIGPRTRKIGYPERGRPRAAPPKQNVEHIFKNKAQKNEC